MKIKCLSILIVAMLALVGFASADTEFDITGMVSSTPMIRSFSVSIESMTENITGYNIAVANAGKASNLKTGLESLGANVDLINVTLITENKLSKYDLLWIPCSGSQEVENAGVSTEILSYVQNGGGLIVTQPNAVITPSFLPYEWEIIDMYWPDGPINKTTPVASVILDSSHPLTQGLTVDDMPDSFDTSGDVASEYTILAETCQEQPTFGTCNYGCGKVIVELDAPYKGSDLTGDDPNLSDAMVERMVSYVACDTYGCNNESIPEFPTVVLPIAAIIGLAFFFQRRN
jgi:hypothetical protein